MTGGCVVLVQLVLQRCCALASGSQQVKHKRIEFVSIVCSNKPLLVVSMLMALFVICTISAAVIQILAALSGIKKEEEIVETAINPIIQIQYQEQDQNQILDDILRRLNFDESTLEAVETSSVDSIRDPAIYELVPTMQPNARKSVESTLLPVASDSLEPTLLPIASESVEPTLLPVASGSIELTLQPVARESVEATLAAAASTRRAHVLALPVLAARAGPAERRLSSYLLRVLDDYKPDSSTTARQL